MKTFLFVNPSSGHYSAARLRRVLEHLRMHEIIPKLFQVRTPIEIFDCCKVINNASEPHLVIVAGGDGTFNAVVNGVEPGTATLAVLPFGTSNVLAAEIGITSIDDGLQRIATGNSRLLSVGVLELETRSLRFVLMAGIGLDGAVVRDVSPVGKRFLKQGAYALSALKNAVAWNLATFELCSPAESVNCHSAIICNASHYGGNFILSPESSPFKPGFSAVCITGSKRRTYVNSILDLFQSRAEANSGLTRIHSSSFDIKGQRPIQIDGDFVGYGPAWISECTDFARIIV